MLVDALLKTITDLIMLFNSDSYSKYFFYEMDE